MREIIDKLAFIKMKNFCSGKDMVKKLEDKTKTRRKYLQKMNLIQDCYLKHTEKY